ncbi:MAG: DUF2490 domain-containing protein [Sphingomonadales bacterium]|nr:DUF2490 domain-containing protein [Sphingomonadales bacterium]NCQ20290.1 DUF2490 domain-containing protein [Sphingomonadales bacterium]NCT02851.1 DUF2490 domain-containing protein [Sphingomonadales bacterium]
MIPGAIRCSLLLAATCAAWQPSKAVAAEEDTQFWLNAIAVGEVAEGTILTIDTSQRWRGSAVGGDLQNLRVTVEHPLDGDTRVGGGIGIFEAEDGFSEVRVHQQAVFTPGRLELRTRLEERFFDSADRVELRLRQRVHYRQPLGRNWRAVVGGEWLVLLQSRRFGRGFSTDQWRAQAGITHTVTANLDVGAIYWLVLSPNAIRRDKINHIPQAVVTYRF